MKLHRLTTFLEEKPKWNALKIYVARLEYAIETDPIVVPETCKALLESICKTVLIERGVVSNRKEFARLHMPQIVQQTMQILTVSDTSFAETLEKIILETNKYRNTSGSTSKGRDLEELSEIEELANMDDIEYCFEVSEVTALRLMKLHDLKLLETESQKESEVSFNEEFNNYLDTEDDIIISTSVFKRSEILSRLDPVAYREQMIEWQIRQSENEENE